MINLSVSLLWLCVLLFVLCGTLLSAAAGIPKFAIVSSATGGIDIGAFNAVYFDSGLTLTADIDKDCQINWQGYDESFFPDSDADCTRFNAFRGLLIIAIVLDYVIALTVYTCLLMRWLPPVAVDHAVSDIRHWCIFLSCLVSVAANAASFGLMVQFVSTDFAVVTSYGISFRMTVAAFAISVVASVIFIADCHFSRVKGPDRVSSRATTSPRQQDQSVSESGISMTGIKTQHLSIASTATRAEDA
jgi:hypothetical protein